MGNHNVVIGCLSAGQLGIGSAATVATRMRAKFPNLRFGLMVGIGGGVPGKKDVRLGDIVVSQPSGNNGGVVQYRFGKWELDNFTPTGYLSAPPQSLLQALANLQARHIKTNCSVSPYLQIFENRDNFKRPESEDILFTPTSTHIKDEETCEKCSGKKVDRRPRSHRYPVIHYGTIASGDCVMKNGEERDSVSTKFGGVLCFEMEAAGLMHNWPCLVIRGICDYADSHKNKDWQPYAAGVAAAFAKELLLVGEAQDTTNSLTEGITDGMSEPTASRTIGMPISHSNIDLLQFICPKADPQTTLEKLSSFSRRNKAWRPWPMDSDKLFQSLKGWVSAVGSSIFIVKAEQGAQARARDFSVEVASFLQSKSQDKVIYAFSSGLSDEDAPDIEIPKLLVYQILRDNPILLSLEPIAIFTAQAKHTEDQLLELLRVIFSQVSGYFAIVEMKDLRCATRILPLFEDVIAAPDSLIKILFVQTRNLIADEPLSLEASTKLPNHYTATVHRQPSHSSKSRNPYSGRDRWKHLNPRCY